jgi:hypothetical protein
MFHFCSVPRFASDQLVSFALHALEDAHRQCEQERMRGSWALRFVLAFLASRCEERWPFDYWWTAATQQEAGDTLSSQFGRRQSLNAALSGIYLQLGRKRP